MQLRTVLCRNLVEEGWVEVRLSEEYLTALFLHSVLVCRLLSIIVVDVVSVGLAFASGICDGALPFLFSDPGFSSWFVLCTALPFLHLEFTGDSGVGISGIVSSRGLNSRFEDALESGLGLDVVEWLEDKDKGSGLRCENRGRNGC